MTNKLEGIIATGFFRTGSTFIFSCLRQVEELHCFYEPYHPEIVDFVNGLEDGDLSPDKQDLGHSIEGNYFEEYRGIDIDTLKQKLALETRTTNQPVLFSGSENLELLSYIEFLNEFAISKGKTPVLQANRFNFTMPWLENVFPNFLKVLITRDPRKVFISLKSLAQKDGVELGFDNKFGDFWNVGEAFNNIINQYNFSRSLLSHFGYYQKLFFIMRFSEWEMSKYTDVVINHDDFCQSPTAILRTVIEPFGYDVSKAIEYATSNISTSKKVKKITSNIEALEQEVINVLQTKLV